MMAALRRLLQLEMGKLSLPKASSFSINKLEFAIAPQGNWHVCLKLCARQHFMASDEPSFLGALANKSLAQQCCHNFATEQPSLWHSDDDDDSDEYHNIDKTLLLSPPALQWDISRVEALIFGSRSKSRKGRDWRC